ncbi:male accessory gland serine protease inhibitor-like [Stomoxys calcitrans]|uniref:male accessory gland serine protease inhibitor-like n=1 Tax=Stomoxys calcitrans TaxID=35570 RepID=UPI0027E2ED31|nr:male accessory gland serine protease inhibitor-like [Stomoxys calcitrans]
MKFFAIVLLAIFALISSSLALKHEDCGLEHSKDGHGDIKCAAYFPSWTYKADSNECIDFVYGGCGGNANRFWSLAECEQKCKE